jgi:hypothetical protein
MNQATRREYLTGRNGFYETDSVRGVTSNMHGNDQYGKTNESFRGGMTGEQLAGRPNYDNPMDNLHDNIGDRVILDQNMDNKIFIDAEFRDTCYTDSKNQPFKFTVRFKNSESMPNREIVVFEYNDEIYEYSKYKKGGREIVFPYVFHNVNFIVIDTLIMPSYIDYITFDDGSLHNIEGMSLVNTYKYIVLKVKQLNNYRKLTNNPNLDNTCFIMKNDDTAGVNNNFYEPIRDQVTSFKSDLQTVDRLDVEICDQKGKPLIPKLDNKPHNFNKDYQDSIEELKLETSKPNGYQDSVKIQKLDNRLKSLKIISHSINPEIHITINNVNPQINTNLKYRR